MISKRMLIYYCILGESLDGRTAAASPMLAIASNTLMQALNAPPTFPTRLVFLAQRPALLQYTPQHNT